MLRALLVEDDQPIAVSVQRALLDDGWKVGLAACGADGFTELLVGMPDLILLDLGLPDMDGEKLLQAVRATSDVPIIVITARDDDHDVVRVLDLGADDVLTKPFSLAQLRARIRAVRRRRTERHESTTWTVGALVLDASRRSAQFQGADLKLRAKEFEILLALAQARGATVTRHELIETVWPDSDRDAERSLDVHLSWIRSKLGETARQPRYIHRLHGVGIRLEAPTTG